jgi:primosomal protein N' (replication factor Y)
MVYHEAENAWRCRLCRESSDMALRCRACGGGEFSHFGAGSERLSRAVADALGTECHRVGEGEPLFPGERRVAVIPAASARRAGPGTAELCVYVNADLPLFVPDFRSTERCFQNCIHAIETVAARLSARTIVLQVRNPGHYAVRAAARGSYGEFLREELAARREAGLPPERHLARIVGQAPDDDGAERLLDGLLPLLPADVEAAGPAPCIRRRTGRAVRWQVVLTHVSLFRLRAAAKNALARTEVPAGCRLHAELSPPDLF